jgi:hypothetical protein
MDYKVIESSEVVWCPSDDRYIVIFKSNDEVVGLNFMQGDELELFKEYYYNIDEDLTDFYNAVEPYLDTRNDEVGKINAAIWAYFSYRNLRDERKIITIK